MTDDLGEGMFGRTKLVKLADGKDYTMREPDFQTYKEMKLDGDLNDPESLKRFAWSLLKRDNPGLSETRLDKLITLTMMYDTSDFMKCIAYVTGRDGESKKAGEVTT